MERIISLNTENKFNLSYEVFFPKGYSEEDADLPLVVFLHGAAERGTNIEQVNKWALPRLISEGLELDAVVLCPQCPWQFVWDNIVRDLKALIDPFPVISQLIFYDVLHLYCVFCQQCKGLLFTGIVDVLRGA